MAKAQSLVHRRQRVISSACSRVGVESGIELFILKRGRGSARPLPLRVAMLRDGFPATILPPSRTYHQTRVPFDGGWTVLGWMGLRRLVAGWQAVIPFERGAREIAAWYLADPARQVIDASLDALIDLDPLIDKLAAAWTA